MEPRGLQPHILALRTLLTSLLDYLPRGDHPPCVFLKTSCCDPPWSVFGIGLDERIEQHPRTLDVSDLCIRFEDDAVEGGKIPFGVYGGGCTIGGGGTGDLQKDYRMRTKKGVKNTWSSFRERILSRA
jgi:hypothetical protein